jgi:hypothetical protein
MPFLFGSGAPARHPGFGWQRRTCQPPGFRWQQRACPLHATPSYKV